MHMCMCVYYIYIYIYVYINYCSGSTGVKTLCVDPLLLPLITKTGSEFQDTFHFLNSGKYKKHVGPQNTRILLPS